MEPCRVLVFDVWGNYAHFSKFFTTTSPLSFPFPPRTTICGLISAILGIARDEYQQDFRKSKASIALNLVNPVKKTVIAQNLINTKGNYFLPARTRTHQPRTQIRFEVMKDVRYRIYINHTDEELYVKLKKFLTEHMSVYTPYLGLSEHLCNFAYVGEWQATPEENGGTVEIESIIPVDQIEEIDFESQQEREEPKEYFTTTIPIEMDEDRTVLEYADVLYERNGHNIRASVKSHWVLTPIEQGLEGNGDTVKRICFL